MNKHFEHFIEQGNRFLNEVALTAGYSINQELPYSLTPGGRRREILVPQYSKNSQNGKNNTGAGTVASGNSYQFYK